MRRSWSALSGSVTAVASGMREQYGCVVRLPSAGPAERAAAFPHPVLGCPPMATGAANVA